MTRLRVSHRFFPVGQGLFAAGSLEFWPPAPRHRRRIDLGGPPKPSPLLPYRWVYDCGSSTARRLIANGIDLLRGDCKDEPIDLLTLSHFHIDHIGGAVELVNKIGARTLMLPWAPLWHRLLIGFDQGLRADDAEIRFFVDPVAYLIQEAGDGFDTVLFVMPSNGEGPPFATEPTFPSAPPEGADREKDEAPA